MFPNRLCGLVRWPLRSAIRVICLSFLRHVVVTCCLQSYRHPIQTTKISKKSENITKKSRNSLIITEIIKISKKYKYPSLYILINIKRYNYYYLWKNQFLILLAVTLWISTLYKISMLIFLIFWMIFLGIIAPHMAKKTPV
jgi:hypothetical protein